MGRTVYTDVLVRGYQNVGYETIQDNARLDVAGGDSGIAPFKIGVGGLTTVPRPGAIENVGDDILWTDSFGVRHSLLKADSTVDSSLDVLMYSKASLVRKEGYMGASEGWYRIASTKVSIGVNEATIRFYEKSYDCIFAIKACISKNHTPTIAVDVLSGLSEVGVTKVRLVYTTGDVNGYYAYVEVYKVSEAPMYATVESVEPHGWELLPPVIPGGVPDDFLTKEITLVEGADFNGIAAYVVSEPAFDGTYFITGVQEPNGVHKYSYDVYLDAGEGSLNSLRVNTGVLDVTGEINAALLNSGVVHGDDTGILYSGNVLLDSEVEGILPVTNGGTGRSSITAGALLYGNGTGVASMLGIGSNNYVLVSNGSAPTWAEKAPNATNADKVGITSSTAKLHVLGVATNASGNTTIYKDQSVTVEGGTVTATTFSGSLSGGTVSCTTLTASSTVTFSGLGTGVAHLTAGVLSVGDVNLANEVTGTLPVERGGTGATTFTAYRLLVGNGASAVSTLGQATSNYVLVGNGNSAVPTWQEKAPKATDADNASNVGVASTSAKLYVAGVLTSASGNSAVYKDQSVTVEGGTVTATTFSGSLNGGAISGTTLTVSSTATFSGLGTGVAKLANGVLSAGSVDLASSEVTGTLVVTKGGTGIATVEKGDILYGSATDTWNKLAIGGTSYAGRVLYNTGTLPEWKTLSDAGIATKDHNHDGTYLKLAGGESVTGLTTFTNGLTVSGGNLTANAGIFTSVKVGGGALLKYADSMLNIRNSADSDWASVKVGNLTVEGTITYINTQDLNVADNIITLNSDVTGTPSENGGIEIKRGTSTNASLLWDESNDVWKCGLVGSESIIVTAANYTDYVKNGSLYLQANGSGVATFTANQSGNTTLNIGTGSSNGTISVGGSDVAVKGLGSNAYNSTAYLPLAGLATVTGLTTFSGGLYIEVQEGTYVSGMTQTKTITFETTSSSSSYYYPYLRGLTYGNHVWNWGGYQNLVGVWGYFAGRTANSYDWRTVWDVSTGNLTHTKGVTVSGIATFGSSVGVASALTVGTTLSVTGATTLTGNLTANGISTIADLRPTLLTLPVVSLPNTTVSGRIENDGSYLYFTDSGLTRHKLLFAEDNSVEIAAIWNDLDELRFRAMGERMEGTLPAVVGWYRIATLEGRASANGLFRVSDILGGSEVLFSASVGVGSNGSLVQIGGSGTTISKVRIAYSGAYAFLEIYNPTVTARLISVEAIGQVGWRLTPGIKGGAPTNYNIVELTFHSNALVANYIYGDGSNLTNVSGGSFSGVLSVTHGGTGMSSFVAGDLLYASSTDTFVPLGIGSTATILYSNGIIPSWKTPNDAGIVIKAGSTWTGVMTAWGSQYTDSRSGALNMNNSNIYGVNSVIFADKCDNSAEGLQWYRDTTTVDSVWVKDGVMYLTPNRTFGSTGTDYVFIHSGNYTDYVKDGTLHLQASGTDVRTFTANQTGATTFNIGTGSSNGTISVAGTDVPVKGLGSNAYTSTAYLPLGGGTMTGVVTFDSGGTSELSVYFDTNRKKANGGGWAYSPIRFRDNADETFFQIGAFGSSATFNYAFLGVNAYDSANNLRIYSDGVKWGTNTIIHAGNYTSYVKDGTLHLQASGTDVTTFTANQTGAATFNIATGSSNGTISVGGTDVSVYGLGTHAFDSTSYLPTGGGTMTGVLKLNGTYIAENGGVGLLAYKISSLTGASNTQWVVGANDVQGVIRSSNTDLIHYKNGVGSTVILDASNFNTYAPTLLGTGASGTWGIDISGTASYVSSAVKTASGTYYMLGATTASGAVGYSTGIYFNPSTNTITATKFSGEATNVSTGSDTSNSLYLVGVKNGATTTLKYDSSVYVQGGKVGATTFIGYLNGNADSADYATSAGSATSAGTATTATNVSGGTVSCTTLTASSTVKFTGITTTGLLNITSGTVGVTTLLSVDYLPVGSGSTQVAAGNHGHLYALSSSDGGSATYVNTTSDTTNTLYVTGVQAGATTSLKYDSSVTVAGGTITAPTGAINKIFVGTTSTVKATGVSFWQTPTSGRPDWQIYMANASTTACGVNAKITAPSGTYVTGYALRSVVQNTANYGWTWEKCASTANTTVTPTIVAELRNDGIFKAAGFVGAGTSITNLNADNLASGVVAVGRGGLGTTTGITGLIVGSGSAYTGLATNSTTTKYVVWKGSTSSFDFMEPETVSTPPINQLDSGSTQTNYVLVVGAGNTYAPTWVEYAPKATDATNASKLSVVKDTSNTLYLLGVTTATATAGPKSVVADTSVYVQGGTLTMSGDLTLTAGNENRYLNFQYTSTGYDWRIGYEGSGSGNANYLVIESDGTAGTTWSKVLRMGLVDHEATFYGTVQPDETNSRNLGTSSLKWSNVYATNLNGNLVGGTISGTTLTASSTVKFTGITTTGILKITSGTVGVTTVIGVDYLPVGSGSTQVAAGNHGHNYALSSSDGGSATYVNTGSSADTSDTLYLLGVKSGALTTVRYNTGLTMKNGTLTGSLSGNASSATKLASGVSVTLTGAVTGTVTSWDGSGNLSVATTLSSHAHGAGDITSGTLPVARGGTGATTLTGVLIGNGTNAIGATSGSSAGQYLYYNGTGYGFTSISVSNVTTTENTSNDLYLLGVKSTATTALLYNSGLSMKNGTLTGTLSGTATGVARATSSNLNSETLLNGFLEQYILKVNSWNGIATTSTYYPGVTDGVIISAGSYYSGYGFQIAVDDDNTGFIALRQRSSNSAWGAWRRFAMGDGTGAGGTWGINISGNAATATYPTVTGVVTTGTGSSTPYYLTGVETFGNAGTGATRVLKSTKLVTWTGAGALSAVSLTLSGVKSGVMITDSNGVVSKLQYSSGTAGQVLALNDAGTGVTWVNQGSGGGIDTGGNYNWTGVNTFSGSLYVGAGTGLLSVSDGLVSPVSSISYGYVSGIVGNGANQIAAGVHTHAAYINKDGSVSFTYPYGKWESYSRGVYNCLASYRGTSASQSGQVQVKLGVIAVATTANYALIRTIRIVVFDKNPDNSGEIIVSGYIVSNTWNKVNVFKSNPNMPEVSMVYSTTSGDVFPYILIGSTSTSWNYVYVAVLEDIFNSHHNTTYAAERTGWTVTVSSSAKSGNTVLDTEIKRYEGVPQPVSGDDGKYLKYETGTGLTWATVSSGSGSVAHLYDIGDVTITSPGAYALLYYDTSGTTPQWKNLTAPSTNNTYLRYNTTNGLEWVTVSGGGGGTVEHLDDIGDVGVTTAKKGDLLLYNGTEWENLPGPTGTRILRATYSSTTQEVTVGWGTTAPAASSATQVYTNVRAATNTAKNYLVGVVSSTSGMVAGNKSLYTNGGMSVYFTGAGEVGFNSLKLNGNAGTAGQVLGVNSDGTGVEWVPPGVFKTVLVDCTGSGTTDVTLQAGNAYLFYTSSTGKTEVTAYLPTTYSGIIILIVPSTQRANATDMKIKFSSNPISSMSLYDLSVWTNPPDGNNHYTSEHTIETKGYAGRNIILVGNPSGTYAGWYGNLT